MITSLVLALAAAATPAEASFVLPSGVKVQIVEAPFKRQDWHVEGCGEDDKICLIDGHPPFGTAWGTPITYVKSITVEYQGRTHLLDVSNMFNAWGTRPLEYPGSVRYFGGKCFSPDHCQLRGLFSDGAGAFVAEWVVFNGRCTRTVLTSSSDVVNLFIKNIDPPEVE